MPSLRRRVGILRNSDDSSTSTSTSVATLSTSTGVYFFSSLCFMLVDFLHLFFLTIMVTNYIFHNKECVGSRKVGSFAVPANRTGIVRIFSFSFFASI